MDEMTEAKEPLYLRSDPTPGPQYGDAAPPARAASAVRRPKLDPQVLAEKIRAGERTAIARAITLVESSKPAHHDLAADLLRILRPDTGKAIRVGITGVPGAGKSTFIAALGRRLIDQGHRIAVLAVDPTSAKTGGSILGDRTRMGELAQSEQAFIRPSPAGSHLGGVALSVIATLLLVIAIVVATAKPADASAARYVPMPRWVIPMRMMTATLLLLVITASATLLGPVVSGMLAPVPVIAWPLAVFAHVQGGRQELAAIVRGNGIGAVGVVGFYLVLQSTLLQWGAVTSVAVGVLLAVVVTFVLAKLLEAR